MLINIGAQIADTQKQVDWIRQLRVWICSESRY